MEEMVRYIFNELQYCNSALKRQRKINCKFGMLIFATGIYAAVMGLHCQEQTKRIDKLSDQIKQMQEDQAIKSV